MLISHKYKFIFIKTKKTAGTSIEVEFAKVLGDEDVVTAVFPPVEGHEARNDRVSSWGGLVRRKFFNHMPATKVRRMVGKDAFDSYFKFCVEREPVEKCLSQYSRLRNGVYREARRRPDSWEEYLELGNFPMDAERYTDHSGDLLVDQILRYENLNAELLEVAAQLGVPFAGLKTKAKAGLRETVEVTREQKELIYKAFAPSNKFTGYTIEDAG